MQDSSRTALQVAAISVVSIILGGVGHKYLIQDSAPFTISPVAKSDPSDISKAGMVSGEVIPISAKPPTTPSGNIDLARANAEIAILKGQKAQYQEKLKSVEAALRAREAPAPYEFDVKPEEWEKLAEEGHIKYRIPCQSPGSNGWTLSDTAANDLGLSPDDRKEVMAAFQRSNERVWKMANALCAEFMDRQDAMELLGTEGCIQTTEKIAAHKGLDIAVAKREVAETRAGLLPVPNQNEWINRLVRAYSALIDEGDLFQKDLEKTFGPEDAERIWHAFPCSKSVQ